MQINEVTSFTACREAMARGQALLVSRTDGSNTVSRMDDMCPVHGSDQCLEVYLARPHVASWSTTKFLQWRGIVRSALRARRAS